MTDQFKQYHLKSFLYYFFIVWNFFIIILLVLLNLYIVPFHLRTPKKISRPEGPRAQIKLAWESISQFQNMDTDVFSMDTVRLKRKGASGVVCLSRQGNMYILDMATGKIQSQVTIHTTFCRLDTGNDRIITGNDQGTVSLFSSSGALSQKLILTNSRIRDIRGDIVRTEKGIYLLDPIQLTVKQSFTYFSNELIGPIVADRLNEDPVDDYIISEKGTLHCFDGLVLKQLWQKAFPFISSGEISTIRDREGDVYLLIPLYNGLIKILNRSGTDVFQIRLNENLVKASLVVRNKDNLFIQPTLENNLYAFDFFKRRNIWSLRLEEKIIDLKAMDTRLDNTSEIFLLTESGRLFVIDSATGALELASSLILNAQEKVRSPMLLCAANPDGDTDILFATDKGNVYKYTYIVLNKKFKLKNLLRFMK